MLSDVGVSDRFAKSRRPRGRVFRRSLVGADLGTLTWGPLGRCLVLCKEAQLGRISWFPATSAIHLDSLGSIFFMAFSPALHAFDAIAVESSYMVGAVGLGRICPFYGRSGRS